MSVGKIKKNFEISKEVKFKLYSLDYVIKQLEDKVIIYQIIYEKNN